MKLGDLPTGIAPVLIFGSLAVFIGGIVVEDKLVLQTDPVEWVDQDSQVIEDLDRLQAETDSSSELGMFVQSDDIFDDTTVGFVDEFAKEQLDEYEDELLTASSIVTTVSFLMEIPGAGNVPPLGAEVEAAFEVAPPDIQKSTADGRRRRAQPHLPHRRRRPRGARRGRARRPRHRRSPGRRLGDARRAWPSWAWASSTTSRRTGSCSPTWRSSSCSSSSPCGCAASCGRSCRWCRCSSRWGRRRSSPTRST